MPGLEAILKKAILNLRSDRLEREEDVKLAVILPILDALDWNPAEPGALRPEYPAGPGRVDYALLCMAARRCSSKPSGAMPWMPEPKRSSSAMHRTTGFPCSF